MSRSASSYYRKTLPLKSSLPKVPELFGGVYFPAID